MRLAKINTDIIKSSDLVNFFFFCVDLASELSMQKRVSLF